MPDSLREVVAAFDAVEALDAAVYALELRGFDRAAFSLLATEVAVARKLGHRYRQVIEVEDDPAVPRETFFSRVSRFESEYLPAPALAGIGAFMLVGAGTVPVLIAAGTGMLIGAALGGLIREHQAKRVQEQLARGGLLLWVNVRNPQQEETAVEILRAHAAHDVHVHQIAA
jgi:hypothetical protein